MRVASAVAALLACAAALCGCMRASVAGDGSVDVVVSVRQAVTAPPVVAVWIRLYGTTAKGQVVDVWAPGKAGATGYTTTFAQLAPGSYQLHGKAFAVAPSGASTAAKLPADYESTVDPIVAVGAKGAQAVTLVLQQNTTLWPTTTFGDAAPVVESVVASTENLDSSDPAATLSLVAVASDRDGPQDLAAFAWTAAYAPALPAGAAPGTFGTPGALATTWAPPPGYDGLVTFTFAATDAKGLTAALSIRVGVSPRNAPGALLAIVDVNSWPDVLLVTAGNAQLVPGGATRLTVTAEDADGDALAYAWSDGACGGRFSDPAAVTTDWVAPSRAGPCAITIAVADVAGSPPAPRGGRNAATLTVNVVPDPVVYGPEFALAVQTPSGAVAPGATVLFQVKVVQPTSDPAVTIPVSDVTWSDGLGGPFVPLAAADPTQVTWSAPPCAALPTPGAATVVATARASGAINTFLFPVAVRCP